MPDFRADNIINYIGLLRWEGQWNTLWTFAKENSYLVYLIVLKTVIKASLMKDDRRYQTSIRRLQMGIEGDEECWMLKLGKKYSFQTYMIAKSKAIICELETE